jgi:hypothetical protein
MSAGYFFQLYFNFSRAFHVVYSLLQSSEFTIKFAIMRLRPGLGPGPHYGS